MTILDRINETKRQEIATSKKLFPVEGLMASPNFNRKCNSLKAALLAEGSSGVIAEFKPKSPSKGVINDRARVSEVTAAYGGSWCKRIVGLNRRGILWGGDGEFGQSPLRKSRNAYSA